MIFKNLFSHKNSRHLTTHSLKIGDIIRDRYEIERSLIEHTIRRVSAYAGRDTYLAIDRDYPFHPRVVIKRLKLPTEDRKILKEARILFDRETEELVKLSNQTNLIPCLQDRFEDRGEFYIVQEYIEGKTLAQVLGNARLSELETVKLIKEILTQLQVLHSHNITHQSITPDNIIRRSSDGSLAFVYCGNICEIRDMHPPEIHVPNQLISWIDIHIDREYRSPEQRAGRPIFSSDIYAVGAIGIQCLVGCSLNELSECPETGEIKWREHCQVSDRFANILNKMHKLSLRYRYNNVVEVLDAI